MQQWEHLYQLLQLDQLDHETMVRRVNGVELEEWKRRRRSLSAHLTQLGDEGWELVAVEGAGYYFKCPKASPTTPAAFPSVRS